MVGTESAKTPSYVDKYREGKQIVTDLLSGNPKLLRAVIDMNASFRHQGARLLFFGMTTDRLVVGARDHRYPQSLAGFNREIVVFVADASGEDPENAQEELVAFRQGQFLARGDGLLQIPSPELISQLTQPEQTPGRSLLSRHERVFDLAGGAIVIPPVADILSGKRIPLIGSKFVY